MKRFISPVVRGSQHASAFPFSGHFLPVFSGRTNFHAATYYYLSNSVVPSKKIIYGVGRDELFEALIREYKIDLSTVIRHDSYGSDFTYIIQAYVPIKRNLVVHFRPEERDVEILYHPGVSEKVLRDLMGFLIQFENKPNYGNVYLVTQNGSSLVLDDFSIQNPKIDFELHYNDDFNKVHEIILNGLTIQRQKGLILLHGIPGSGKTTYLRHLIVNTERRFIYMPSELAHLIAEPSFLNFISGYPDSVLLIEDAEEILAPRSGKGNSAISNLLNLGDGLLSDCLKIQVICTFNAPLTRIDPALLRKGRIIANYEFKALETLKANRLIASTGRTKSYTHPVSLAEIFHSEEEDFSSNGSRTIGFGIAS